SFIVSRHQIDTRAADLFLAPVQDAERALAAAWEAAAAAAPPSPLPYSSLDELLADEPCLELLQRQQGEQGQGFVRLVFSTLLQQQQQQQQPQQHQQQQQQEGRLEGEEARQQRGQQGETRVTPPRPRMQSAPDTVTAAKIKRGDGGGGGGAPARDNDSPAGGVIGGSGGGGGGGDDLGFIEEREDDGGEEVLAGGGGGGLYGTEYGEEEEEDQEEGAFDAMYGTVADPYGDDVTVDDVDYGGGGLGDDGLGGLGRSAADALEEVGEADDAAAEEEEEEEEQQEEEGEGVHATAAATTHGTARRYGAGSPMTARTTHRSASASATSATTTLTTTAAEHWPLRPDLLRHYVRLVFSGPGAAERLAAAAALTLAAAGLRTTVAAAAGATAVRAHGSYDARRFQMPLPELLRRLRKTVPQLLPPVPEAASAGRVGSAAADVLVVGSWLLKRPPPAPSSPAPAL
ncbi:hypothetical protein Agub_g14421, partial [Astrephomene gubernaculifera]